VSDAGPPGLDKATQQVLRQVLEAWEDGRSLVVVSSPPGGGKTWLIEALAWIWTQKTRSACWVACNTNSQADSLVARLAQHWEWPGSQKDKPLPIRRLVAQGYGGAQVPDPRRVPRPERVDKEVLRQPWVWVSTASKITYSMRPWDKDSRQLPQLPLLILDEAYQMRLADLATFSSPFQRLVLIGDPGQLAPVTTIDTTWLQRQQLRPHLAAPQRLLELLPKQAVCHVQIQRTRRLPQDSAQLVQQLLYPNLWFDTAGELFPGAPGVRDPLAPWRRLGDQWAQAANQGATLVLMQLDEESPSVDQRARAGTAWVQAMVQAGADPSQIGVVCPHRIEVVRQRAELATLANASDERLYQVQVETAERWQGREVDWVLAWHPLDSGDGTGEFVADTGRLCVMLSRHRRGCVVLVSQGTGGRVQRLGESDPEPGGSPSEKPGLGEDHSSGDGKPVRVPAWQAHRGLYQWAKDGGRILAPPSIQP
jgi:hypothetical protein